MAANPETIFETIEFTLNGKSVEALAGETIIQAAKRTSVSESDAKLSPQDTSSRRSSR